MSEMADRNAYVIAQFRENAGKIGDDDVPLVLLHHLGRRSGREYVSPVVYLAHETDPDVMYVFASKGGAPTHPDWYHNLAEAGDGSVEVGTEAYQVTVRELSGDERDRVYAEQARRFPNFGEYEVKAAGIRTIPVLELSRA